MLNLQHLQHNIMVFVNNASDIHIGIAALDKETEMKILSALFKQIELLENKVAELTEENNNYKLVIQKHNRKGNIAFHCAESADESKSNIICLRS